VAKPEPKVAAEVAEQEYERWVDAMALELDYPGIPDAVQRGVARHRHRLIGAIQRGDLVVDDEGRFVFTPRKAPEPAPIVFHEPTGATLMGIKEADEVKRGVKILAAVTHQNEGRFAKMANSDLSVCSSIIELLFFS
jgi:hypothetical protein